MKVLMISQDLIVGDYHGKLRELSRLGVELTAVVPSQRGKQRREIVESSEYELVVAECIFSGANHFHFYHYFERFAFQHVQAAIAGNEEAQSILRTRRFPNPTTVIPQFGVDPEFFRKRNVRDLKSNLGLVDRFAIGYVGRIVKEKGISDLVRAMVSLPEKCVLVIVGSGPFEPKVRQLAESLGVAPRIQWIAHVSSLEIPNYMNLLDVLILPSRTTRRWKEQFGRVLVEAMACETPVVGSSSGEIPRVIGEAGLVFPEGDVRVLADQLRHLCESRDYRVGLGVKGRARVLENFTHRRIAEQTVG